MRLLHVTDTFLPKLGGAEIAIDSLVRAMIDAGHSCTMLAQQTLEPGQSEIAPPYPLRRFGTPSSALWSGWQLRQRIATVESELGPFDAYIGHHAFPPGYAVVRHARALNRPAIVHVRGGDIYHGSRYRRKKLAWAKLTWALKNAAAVVCLSQAMRDLVSEIIDDASSNNRIDVIPNGVHLAKLRADASASRFAAEKIRVPFNSETKGTRIFVSDNNKAPIPFVLGLGRTIRRKGFHLLIDAFARTAEPGWRLVIAGEGRELEELRKQAGPLGDRVLFTGLVDGPDKRWLLQNCRFVAAPSLEESFPNVALEALACGKPVIGTTTGFVEMIRQGENGLLVPPGNVDALAEALHEYQRADLTAASQAALAAAETFSWPSVVKRYMELIETFIKRS